MISHIHFIHHSHTDFGYTDEPERVLIQQNGYLEQALNLIESTRRGPAEEKFFWTVESSFVAKDFCRRYGTRGKKRILTALECGQLEIAGFLHQPITHLQSLEELHRSVDWTCRLYEEAGSACRVAILCDLGSATWSLADVLSEHGIKMFILAVGCYRVLSPWSELPPVFWWKGPRGGQVLFYTYHIADTPPEPTRTTLYPACYGWGYLGFVWPARKDRKLAGEVIERTAADELVETGSWPEVAAEPLLGRLENDGYPCSSLLVQIASDNAGPDPNVPADITWLNQRLETRTARLGLAGDFAEEVANDPTMHLPVLSGDLHCSWSDQAISLPAAIAHHREAARLSRAAIHMSRNSRARKETTRMTGDVYDGLLAYTDHTFGLSSWGFGEMKQRGFGPWDPISRFHDDTWIRKETFAHSAWLKARQIHADSQERLVQKLPRDSDVGFVNTLDRSCNPQIMCLTAVAASRPTAWKSGSKMFPVQAESIRPKWWRVWVPIPSLPAGKVMSGALQCGQEHVAGTEIAGHTHASENSTLTAPNESNLCLGACSLKFDEQTGRCVSWRSADGQERLGTSSGHGLGELIYAEVEGVPEDPRGGGIGWPIERRFATCESVVAVPGSTGPLTVSRIARRRLVSASGLRLETATEWRLLAGHDEVHITVTMDKPRNVLREDGRVAFPFAGPCRDLAWDVADGVATWKDLLPGSHTGWLTVQSLIAIECEWGSVVLLSLDAPLLEVGGMSAETWRGHTKPPTQATSYCYAFNNFYQTNIPQWHGGHVAWRFLLRCFPGPLDTDEIWKWAEERDGGIVGLRRTAANP